MQGLTQLIGGIGGGGIIVITLGIFVLITLGIFPIMLIVLGIGSVGTTRTTDGIFTGPNSIKDGIGDKGPKFISLGIGGTTEIIDGIFILGMPISKLGNITGGKFITASGTVGMSISKGGKAGHSGICMKTGSGATGIAGSTGLFLIVGVCTILQLFVSTLTTGSIVAEDEYKCVPVKELVVDVPSPKSILKLVYPPKICKL